MSTTALTLATAPRDRDSLLKIGRFNARVLAQDGGMFGTLEEPNEEAKATFMQFSSEEQADALIKMFERIDGKKAGKAAAATTASGRQPATGAKTGGKKPAEAETTTTTTTTTAAATTATGRAPATAAPGEGTAKLLKSIQAIESVITDMGGALSNLGPQLSMQQQAINNNTTMTLLVASIVLQLAEQVLQAPQKTIIQMSLEDLATLRTTMSKLMPSTDESDGIEVADDEEEAEGNG